MEIGDVANKLNSLAINYKIGTLQQLRKELKGHERVVEPHIFSSRTIFNKDRYAYHWGGREEIQFNIGKSEDNTRFRYGLAFSIESSRTLPDPVLILAPKVGRFNDFISNNLVTFSDLVQWHVQNDVRSPISQIGPIGAHLIKNGTFIFVGKYLDKSIEELSRDDYRNILETFDKMLEIYRFVESSSNPEKIARLCWNDEYWQRPSGPNGKSSDKNSYEYNTGFGSEEWLFDTEKIIAGYHYGNLPQIGHNWKTYIDKIFNISVFSIDNRTRDRWWIGKINNCHIIDENEARKAFAEYKKRGWVKEMKKQLQMVGADASSLDDYTMFTLKFKPEDLHLLDSPLRILPTDTNIKNVHYSTLLSMTSEPCLESNINRTFTFTPKDFDRKDQASVSYGARVGTIDIFHNRMQKNVIRQLENIYTKDNVSPEQPTGLGSKIDIAVQHSKGYIFYELKTSNSLRTCIREALTQLLEYAYYPMDNRASKLIIVSQNHITADAQNYLKTIRSKFKIPVFYQRYDPETKTLEQCEY